MVGRLVVLGGRLRGKPSNSVGAWARVREAAADSRVRVGANDTLALPRWKPKLRTRGFFFGGKARAKFLAFCSSEAAKSLFGGSYTAWHTRVGANVLAVVRLGAGN